ncbi:MAG: adenylate/guanylate cyclase domain-containing protein [Planctomycetota bacterium]
MSQTLEIEILDGDQAGEHHSLSGIAVIGRGEACSLRLQHPAISREHTMIRAEEGVGWVLEDLDSRSGTYVNGVHARKAVLLDGDTVRVGPISLRVRTQRPLLGEVPPDEVQVVQTRFMPTTRLSLDVVKFRTSARFLKDSGPDHPRLDAAGTPLPEPAEPVAEEEPSEIERRLELMLQISNGLAAIHQPARLTRETAVRLSALFPQARRIGFFALEEEEPGGEGVLRPSYLVDRSLATRGSAPPEAVQISRSVLQEAIEQRRAILSEDIRRDPRFKVSESLSNAGVISMICAPLCLGERVLGAIYLDTADLAHPFDEGALRLVTGVGALLAAAFENARLFARVQAETLRRASLERYFSPDLVERVLKGDLPLAREGRKAEGTILFVDIRGFTSLTLSTDPNVLVATLNAYFASMQRIIFRTRGTVERFGGDSILAYWGIVDDDREAPAHALRAALAMQVEVFRLNPELLAAGRPAIQIAVGLNSGEVIAGDVGSAERYEFTILGDAINMARRFEALAGPWEVIAGEATVAALGEQVLHVQLPPTTVKGKEAAVHVSLVHGLRAEGADRWELAVPGQLRFAGAGAQPQQTLASALELGREAVLEVLTPDDPEPDTRAAVRLRLPRAAEPLDLEGKVLPAQIADTLMLGPNLAVTGSGVQRIRLAIPDPRPLLAYLGVVKARD